jgi:hypothetical protein
MRITLDVADDVLRSAEHPLLSLGIRPLPMRGGVLDNELIKQLRDDGGY